MTDFSELMVFFLMLPVLIQIIIPLFLLLGVGFLRAIGTVTGRQKQAQLDSDNEKAAEDLILDKA